MNTTRFITDELWNKMNYQKLVDLAEDEDYAGQIVEFLDQNPEIRQDISGIYFKAKETLANK